LIVDDCRFWTLFSGFIACPILTALLSVILYPGCTSNHDIEKAEIEQYIENTIVPLFETEYSITDDWSVFLYTITSYSESEFFKIFDDIAQRMEQLYRDYREAVRRAPIPLFDVMKKLEESSGLVVQAHTIYRSAYNQTDISLFLQYIEEGDNLIAHSEQLKQEAGYELIDVCEHYDISVYDYFDDNPM